MKLGVITDCFKIPLEDSLRLAAELGFHGVQIYATKGAFSPDSLTPARKAEIKALLAEKKLEISALCGDMGGHGFQRAEDNPARVEKTKRIIDLAVEFGTKVVTTHIGVIPADKADPQYRVLLDAMTECGAYAASKGVTMAIETGPETAPVLLAFVKDIPCGVGVNLDPANFVMVTGQDPVEAVELLGNYIVHTHAKDGVMLKKVDPRAIYDKSFVAGENPVHSADCFREVPLGEGSVDFDAYIAALRRVGFDGYLTIERETGADPIGDITRARDTLRAYL